jgi:hypothetical protein
MDSTADHEFNPKTASNALNTAAAELAVKAGTSVDDLAGQRMGALYDLAVETFGAELPEFWVIWNGWNTASDDPAPWGEL